MSFMTNSQLSETRLGEKKWSFLPYPLVSSPKMKIAGKMYPPPGTGPSSDHFYKTLTGRFRWTVNDQLLEKEKKLEPESHQKGVAGTKQARRNPRCHLICNFLAWVSTFQWEIFFFLFLNQ